MRILGISFGRKNGNCDVALKISLKAAKKSGHEIRFINTCNLKIDRCNGCGACDKMRDRGGMSLCVHKDDFQALEKEIIDADALILAAPVYVLGPTGQYKNVVDRIGPSHDWSQLELVNQQRKAAGMNNEQLIPQKYFKERPIAYISVGGARTEGWTSMGLSGMYLLGFTMHTIPVDSYNLYAMGDMISPVLDDACSARLSELGRHIADAVDKPKTDITWQGLDQGICPVCHCNQITFRHDTTVECSICGSIGEAKIENGKLYIDFSPEQIKRSRLMPGGDMEHILEIQDMGSKVPGKLAAYGDELQTKLKELDCIVCTNIGSQMKGV